MILSVLKSKNHFKYLLLVATYKYFGFKVAVIMMDAAAAWVSLFLVIREFFLPIFGNHVQSLDVSKHLVNVPIFYAASLWVWTALGNILNYSKTWLNA